MDVRKVKHAEKRVYVRAYDRCQANGWVTVRSHWRRPRGTLVTGLPRHLNLEKGVKTLS